MSAKVNMLRKGRTSSQPFINICLLLVTFLKLSTEQTTWINALRDCRRRESVIATTNQSGFWSPGVTFSTPWLSLIDCRQPPANVLTIEVNIPEACLVHCLSQNYTVFGLNKQSKYRCWCLNDTTIQFNAQCSMCSPQSKLLCGNSTGMAVYSGRTDLELFAPASNQCLSLQCKGVLLTPRSCDDYERGLCAQNSNEACVSFEAAIWRNYSTVSYCPQLYYPQTEAVCSNDPLYFCGPSGLSFPRTSSFWIHTIRETVTCHVNSDNTCVNYLLNVQDIQNMQCSHVTEDGADTFSSCNDSRMFECNESKTTTEKMESSTVEFPTTTPVKSESNSTSVISTMETISSLKPPTSTGTTALPSLPTLTKDQNEENEDKLPILWIVVGVVVFILVLVVVIIVVIRFRKHKMEKEEKLQGTLNKNANEPDVLQDIGQSNATMSLPVFHSSSQYAVVDVCKDSQQAEKTDEGVDISPKHETVVVSQFSGGSGCEYAVVNKVTKQKTFHRKGTNSTDLKALTKVDIENKPVDFLVSDENSVYDHLHSKNEESTQIKNQFEDLYQHTMEPNNVYDHFGDAGKQMNDNDSLVYSDFSKNFAAENDVYDKFTNDEQSTGFDLYDKTK